MSVPAVYDDNNVLKKASHVITATHRADVSLTRQDRVLMDYLLFRAYDELTPQGVYRLATKEVMEYTRITRHKDLVESIQRLDGGAALQAVEQHRDAMGERAEESAR